MTTPEELLAADPDPSHGRLTQFPAGPGAQWLWFVELADPEAGSGIEWHSLTGWVTGVMAAHGADQPHGSARAAVTELAVRASDDRFAPWNPDTSSVFGVHVRLGAGLYVRGGLMRVAGGDTVTDVRMRFTSRVRHWGDSSTAMGRIRRHRILARDLSVNLKGSKLPNAIEANWPDRVATVTADWPFGIDLYGAVLDEPAGDPVITLAEREEAPSAATELDDTVGPAGAVWYTNRRGRLIVRPQIGDTWHAGLFAGGATGTPWVDPAPIVFSHAASADGGVAYVIEPDGGEAFGLDDDEQTVYNDLDVTVPDDPGYLKDDPGSIDRHGTRTLSVVWQVRNDTAADDLIGRLAYASQSARPLIVNERDTGFLQALGLEWGNPLEIRHTSRPGRQIVTATGRCRRTVDQITPLPGGRIRWRLTVDADVDATDATDPLLPPEDLIVDELEDGYALFDWTDPAQAVTPTVTQVRMIGASDIWLDLDYPLGELAWLWLDPETTYRFEARYLVVDDGLTTHVSPAATVTFTTPAPDDEPLVPPWLDDEGDPTAPPDECTDSPALEDPPFDDESLVVFTPLWCPPDRIIEAVTETEADKGPALAGFMFDDDDNVALVTDELAGSVAYGASDLLAGLNAGDVTIGCDVTIGTQDTQALWDAAGLRIGCQSWGSGWRPRAVAYTPVGESTVVGDELPLDEWHRLAARWARATGTLELFVDLEPVNDTTAGEDRQLVNALPIYRAAIPAASAIANCAVWASAVEIEPPPPATLFELLLSLNPLVYYPLRAGALTDFGSLASNLASYATGGSGTQVAGADGFNYYRIENNAHGGAGPSTTQLSIGTHSGLTVVCLHRPYSAAGSSYLPIVTKISSVNVREWHVGRGVADTWSTSNAVARQRSLTTVPAQDTWHLQIARFPSSTTGNPSIRSNGTTPANSTFGSGTRRPDDTYPLRIGSATNAAGQSYRGHIAHVAIFAGSMSTDDSDAIEAMADAEGWF